MSIPEIAEEIVNLNEAYSEKQTALLSEILVRSMQQAGGE